MREDEDNVQDANKRLLLSSSKLSPSKLRPSKQFTESSDIAKEANVKGTNKPQLTITTAKHFDSTAKFISFESYTSHQSTNTKTDTEYDSNEQLNKTSLFSPSRFSTLKKVLLGGLTLFTVAGIAQLIARIMQHIETSSWLSLLFDVSLLTLATSGIFAILNEIRKLKRLKQQLAKQLEAQALIDANQHHGAGEKFCEQLAKTSGLAQNSHHEATPSFQYFLSLINERHSDAEVLQIYDQFVLKPFDQKALKLIEKNMLESGLLVAVSPLAIVDMLFVAWRNIRLVNQIAEVYGIEISYWARIRLFRQVLINVAFVGGTELLSELGSDILSQDILSRFSTRAAQGIGAGFLTARLGIQTMQLCRPIPFLNDKPRLKDLRSQLVSKLSLHLKKN